MASETWAGQRVVLRAYPEGALKPSDFAVEAAEAPALAEGQFRVRNLFASVDPMLRLFIDKKPMGGAMPPMPLGTTIPGAAVGDVVESRHPEHPVGARVEGRFGWQHYAVLNGAGVQRINGALGPAENALGIGGLPGFTAYVGLHVANLTPGQTVLVSGAAGAVGSVVGPLVRARGGCAVGIAAGAEKRRYLIEQAEYDAVADRTAPDFAAQLKAALPQGANLYFDNVGGPMLLDVLPVLARGALVLICGLMAQYQDDGGPGAGPDRLPVVMRAVMGGLRIQGFTQLGQDALRPAFEQEMAALLRDGKIKPVTHIVEGLARLPEAMCGLFNHAVTGKVVVRVAEEAGK